MDLGIPHSVVPHFMPQTWNPSSVRRRKWVSQAENAAAALGVVRTGQLESKKGDAEMKPVSQILCAWMYNHQRELQCLKIFLRVGFYISLDIQTIVSHVGFLFPYLY